ncbi:hypothetical protein D3C76_1367110 [compost metagenome]
MLGGGAQVALEQRVEGTQAHARLAGQEFAADVLLQVVLDVGKDAIERGRLAAQALAADVGLHQGEHLARDDLRVLLLHAQ